MDYFGNKCLSCGKAENLTIDHVKPFAKGGHNVLSNIQLLCINCNSQKLVTVIDFRSNFKPLEEIETKLCEIENIGNYQYSDT